MITSLFRSFSVADSLRSDRSARDRQRHRQKVRESIRENITDLIAEESIIGKDKDKIIKVPIRGVKEYRFIYGDNAPGVGQGDGDTQAGQTISKGQASGQGQSQEKAGNQPGVDYYETDVTLEELIEIMFADLALPDMERKHLREVMAARSSKRKGYRHAGIRIRLDKKRTVLSRLKRRLAVERRQGEEWDEERRFPFHQDDIVYRHMVEDIRPDSNAVVICLMDTSGSMDTMKKYLARSFFFLLYQFVSATYQNVECVFIAHHSDAREVSEDEFFHKGESGGTLISSGYHKAFEIIQERYHPALWNIYAFHCSDGDNFESDNALALTAAQQLCEVCNLFGYGEIKPYGTYFYESSMLSVFRRLIRENFQTVKIERKEDIWPSFTAFLAKEKPNIAAAGRDE
jgi:sporulation protein YhbH